MDISISSNTITILGDIKTIDDFKQIKTVMDSVTTTIQNITLVIKDSISITSSVIGYFNKLILKDNINITMHIGTPQLLELLGDLNLSSTFNVKKA